MNQLQQYSSYVTAERLKGFVIDILLDGNTRQCASVPGQLSKGETRRISCMPGAIGSIVQIRMTDKKAEALTICEVEVFGLNGKTQRCV